MESTKKARGGKREGAGRKRTTAKRYGFNAPQDVMDILEQIKGSTTGFVCDAIREKAERDGLKK